MKKTCEFNKNQEMRFLQRIFICLMLNGCVSQLPSNYPFQNLLDLTPEQITGHGVNEHLKNMGQLVNDVYGRKQFTQPLTAKDQQTRDLLDNSNLRGFEGCNPLKVDQLLLRINRELLLMKRDNPALDFTHPETMNEFEFQKNHYLREAAWATRMSCQR